MFEPVRHMTGVAVLLFLITALPARAQEKPLELFTYAELVQLRRVLPQKSEERQRRDI